MPRDRRSIQDSKIGCLYYLPPPLTSPSPKSLANEGFLITRSDPKLPVLRDPILTKRGTSQKTGKRLFSRRPSQTQRGLPSQHPQKQLFDAETATSPCRELGLSSLTSTGRGPVRGFVPSDIITALKTYLRLARLTNALTAVVSIGEGSCSCTPSQLSNDHSARRGGGSNAKPDRWPAALRILRWAIVSSERQRGDVFATRCTETFPEMRSQTLTRASSFPAHMQAVAFYTYDQHCTRKRTHTVDNASTAVTQPEMDPVRGQIDRMCSFPNLKARNALYS